MLTKLTSFMRRNERSLIPGGLVFLLITSAALLVINKQGPQSLVPMPFEQLQRPEEPAVAIKSPKGSIQIPRRTVRAWQELQGRALFRNRLYKNAISSLPSEYRQVFDRSAIEFCDQYEGSNQQLSSSCGQLIGATASEAHTKTLLGAWALASSKARGKEPSPTAVKAASVEMFKNIRSTTGISSNQEALEALGLSTDDVKQQVEMDLAWGDVNTLSGSAPSDPELTRWAADHADRFRRPAETKPILIASPDRPQAQRVYDALKPEASMLKVKELLSSDKPLGSILDYRWLDKTLLPGPTLKEMSQHSAGYVGEPFWMDTYWVVAVTGPFRAAQPLPRLGLIHDKVEQDWLQNKQDAKLARAVSRLADRFSDNTFCDSEIVNQDKQFSCGMRQP